MPFSIRYSGSEQYYPSNECIGGGCNDGSTLFWHIYWDNGYSDYQKGSWSYTLPILAGKTSVFWTGWASGTAGGPDCLNGFTNQSGTLCQNLCYGNNSFVFRGFDGTQYSLPIASIRARWETNID